MASSAASLVWNGPILRSSGQTPGLGGEVLPGFAGSIFRVSGGGGFVAIGGKLFCPYAAAIIVSIRTGINPSFWRRCLRRTMASRPWFEGEVTIQSNARDE